MKNREMKVLEFKKMLKQKGFSFYRSPNGGHEIWKNEKSETFSFPVNSKNIKAGIIWNFNRRFGGQT